MIVNVTRNDTAHLDDDEMRRVAIKYICDKFDVSKESRINGENLVIEEERSGHTSWYENVVVRKATNEDVIAVNMLRIIGT